MRRMHPHIRSNDFHHPGVNQIGLCLFFKKPVWRARGRMAPPCSLSVPGNNHATMTLTRADDAVAAFTGGYSCSQAVAAAFTGDFGVDRETVLRLSCSFGGGMAHTGNTCGAVTGALMVIGMKYGRTAIDDLAAKEKTYAVANAFITEFLHRNHAIGCTDLIGHNLGDPKELAIAREKDLFHTKCTRYVRDAGEILEKLL